MRIPRNDLCPCGSGKKYKTCHGKTSARGSVFGFDSDALQKLEAMQQQIVDIVRRLEDGGEITINAGEETEELV